MDPSYNSDKILNDVAEQYTDRLINAQVNFKFSKMNNCKISRKILIQNMTKSKNKLPLKFKSCIDKSKKKTLRERKKQNKEKKK